MHVDRLLPGATSSFDDDEEKRSTPTSTRSEKTVSIEEDEIQETQSKGVLPSNTNESTPNKTSPSKSLKDDSAPQIIDLTGLEVDKKETTPAPIAEKTEKVEQRKSDKENGPETEETQAIEPEKANENGHKPKRKSKRESNCKRSSSKPRKSKKDVEQSKDETDNKEKSTKKKSPKRTSIRKVAPSNQVEATGESSRPIPKKEAPPVVKSSAPLGVKPSTLPKTTKASSEVPTTPSKQENNIRKSTQTKKGGNPDDFQKRKEAKAKRADDLRNYLGTVGDTLMVEPRSDDSVSYLTIPQAIQGDADHNMVDLNKLPKPPAPLRTVNPMISMGDDGEFEPERRISYDLEALMGHRVPSKTKQNKWENVSVITDDIETVLGENEKAEIISLQSNGIKFGHESSRNTEFTDIDLEQPSKKAASSVDCKTESRPTVVTVLEDLQNLMIRRPLLSSVTFVFLVATLVFLGIALMQ